jgi:predicted neuraminidase
MIERRQFLFAAGALACPGLYGADPDPALQPPRINTEPGREYADANRKFQGIPGIEQARNGRLWALWYSGDKREGPQNYVVLTTSGDDGTTWSGPQLVIDPEGFVRAFDAGIWHDPQGRLWVFWAQAAGHWDGRAGVWAITTRDSGSAKPTWSKPRRITDGVLLNKPLVLQNGPWLLPVMLWTKPPNLAFINDRDKLNLSADQVRALVHDPGEKRGPNVFSTSDRGRTFTCLGRANFPDADQPTEPMLIERKDGGLRMFVRTRYAIGTSDSSDGGHTWSAPRDSGIAHPSTRFFIRRLKSGRLILVKNDPPNGQDRSHLTAFLSENDGSAWEGGLVLDERMNVSYPDGVEGRDGVIRVIYDRERFTEREILMAAFREEDVTAGKRVTPASRLKVLVNRAGKRE